MTVEAATVSENVIRYVVGDAASPVGEGTRIIAHCCNHLGYWGAGFTQVLDHYWPHVGVDYREWIKSGFALRTARQLGEVRYVQADELIIASIVGQDGVKGAKNVKPIRYSALGVGFQNVAIRAIAEHCSVHMPRIGCGLAGGTWDKVEPLIQRYLIGLGVPVYVYDLGA
jgi:O-acetyl-ADP-ribose deacetylase (regulator of RNase III)